MRRRMGPLRGFRPLSRVVAHGWASFDGAGIGTPFPVSDSYNLSSVTDNGTGDYTLTWGTAFQATGYAVVAMGRDVAGAGEMLRGPHLKATVPLGLSTTRIMCRDRANVARDPRPVMVLVMGDP